MTKKYFLEHLGHLKVEPNPDDYPSKDSKGEIHTGYVHRNKEFLCKFCIHNLKRLSASKESLYTEMEECNDYSLARLNSALKRGCLK